jgi:hypothetical protein
VRRYLLNFTFTLYVVYPRAGDGTLLFVSAFNDPLLAVKKMLELGFGQLRFPIELRSTFGDNARDSAGSVVNAPGTDELLPAVSELSLGQQVTFALFCVVYIGCLVMLSILLLRLFMAMLSATYNAARQAAQLEWRLQFARYVIRAELMHPRWLGDTECGEMIDGKRMYVKTARRSYEHPGEYMLQPAGLQAMMRHKRKFSVRTGAEGEERLGAHNKRDALGDRVATIMEDVDSFDTHGTHDTHRAVIMADLDGDGVPDMPVVPLVENDIDGDGFPDDVGSGSFRAGR